MSKLIICIFLAFPWMANAELLMIEEGGDLALSTDSIEIKSREGKKIVQGIVYGFKDGVKTSMGQFILSCGEFGGLIQFKEYEQNTTHWVSDGHTRADIIGKMACQLPKPEIVKAFK